jgi:peptide-methionine (S)-S-oxide reductase
VGTHYRSAIFFTSQEQRLTIESYIKNLEEKRIYANPIVTEIVVFEEFYPAEVEHQEYYQNNPFQPYCQFVIKPKLDKKKEYLTQK